MVLLVLIIAHPLTMLVGLKENATHVTPVVEDAMDQAALIVYPVKEMPSNMVVHVSLHAQVDIMEKQSQKENVPVVILNVKHALDLQATNVLVVQINHISSDYSKPKFI